MQSHESTESTQSTQSFQSTQSRVNTFSQQSQQIQHSELSQLGQLSQLLSLHNLTVLISHRIKVRDISGFFSQMTKQQFPVDSSVHIELQIQALLQNAKWKTSSIQRTQPAIGSSRAVFSSQKVTPLSSQQGGSLPKRLQR